MNTTTAIVGGVVAVLIIGGLIFYNTGTTNSSSTNTVPISVSTGNGGNTGQVSPPEKPQTPGVPNVVTSAKAFPADTTVVVTGSVIPNGAFTNYWYEFGTTEGLGNKTSTQNIGSGYAEIPAPTYITKLPKDTTYFFRLVAQNKFGTVAGSVYSFKTTHDMPTPVVGGLPNVKTVSASGIARTKANLNGEVTPNKAMTVHWFEYGQTPNLGSTTALVSVGDGSTKVSASIALSDLEPATTYYFRLNAQNQFGTENGSILNFKTDGPPRALPPSVTTKPATNIGTSTAVLMGTINPGGEKATYWFEYSTDSLLGSVLIHSTDRFTGESPSKNISAESKLSGLNPNTNYYFRLVAENEEGVTRGERQTFKTK